MSRGSSGASTHRYYLGVSDTAEYRDALKKLQDSIDSANTSHSPDHAYKHAVKKISYSTGKVGLYWREIFIPICDRK